MKVSELRKLLRQHGCYEVDHGKEHDVWFSPITKAKMRIPKTPYYSCQHSELQLS